MLSRVLNIIEITRPFNCLITFMSVFLGGFIISESTFNLNLLLFASISASLIAAGGNVINDIYDIEIDKISHPERSLPSNKISISQAKFLYFIINLIVLLILIPTSLALFLIGAATILLLFLYASFLKKVFLVSNLLIAFLTCLTFIFVGVAVDNLGNSTIIAGFAFLINLIREIIKDTEDIDGDIHHGIKSIPIILGIKKTRWIVMGLTIILILFTTYPFFAGIYKIEYFVLVMIIINPILIIAGKLFLDGKNDNDIKKASLLLKLNMILGLVSIYFGK